jgi:bifunctional non-homologous end joining protein LigD
MARAMPQVRTQTSGRGAGDALGRGNDIVDQLSAIESSGGSGEIEFGRGSSLAVSNLGKVYFPTTGHTKGDVMRHYARAAAFLLPVLQDRPLVLKRWPDGIKGQSFFQQKAPDRTPPGVRVEAVPAEGKLAPRVVGGDLLTLLYCVQLGMIATNPWHSRVQSLQYPDYSMLDLDPGPRAPFRKIVHLARQTKELLEAAGLTAGLKTSGKRGMHIFIPLPPKTNAEAALLVAQIFAKRVADAHPRDATVIRSVNARAATVVYMDYLQNVVGKSMASAFSVRANPGATVSTPLAWDELTDDLDPRAFTIDSIVSELPKRGDLWAKAMRTRNRLERMLK